MLADCRRRASRPKRRAAALAALAAGLSAFTINREIGPHDEGLMLQAAARLARGQVPYRDFRLNYPPGQAIMLAGLYKAAGPSLRGWRVMRIGVDAATTALAYGLARRHASEPAALTAGIGVAGAMAFPNGAGPNPPAQALALSALLVAGRRPRAAGLIAGLATAFRIEVGAATAVGIAVAAPAGSRGRALRAAVLSSGAALSPFAAAAPKEMFEDTIGFFAIQRLQRLPFPLRFEGRRKPSKLIEFYAPAILIGGLGAWTASVMTRPRCTDHETLAPAPLAAVGAGYLLARTDEFHLVTLAATLPVLLATALEGERRPLHRLALITALGLITAHGLDRKAGQALHPPCVARVPGPAGQGVNTSMHDAGELAQVLDEVHRLTAPGEAIFVANSRHDLIRVGNPLLYTLLDRPNATRYDVMQPGVVTTEAVQREIVESLAGVRVVVRWLHPTASDPEPNGAGRSSGVKILDTYLANEFCEQARIGNYAVLLRAERMSISARASATSSSTTAATATQWASTRSSA
jgi:hypothetical protein